jgi:ubiquinone/menaquinone biosynthesis C-methylase UbiE
MESPSESERLWVKSNEEQTRAQLLGTGLTSFAHAPTVLDAGSGPGFVGRIMADELEKRYVGARLVQLDISPDRLEYAKQKIGDRRGVKLDYVTADLQKGIPLPDASVDYIFCRFVIEYLHKPEAAVAEMNRVLKPGGRLVLADLDYNCLSHYPMSPTMESNIREIVDILVKAKYFDPFAGRKLFHYLRAEKYTNIDVTVSAHHLFYKNLPEADRINWQAKLDMVVQLQKSGTFKMSFDAAEFAREFMAFFTSTDRFSYTPLLIACGVKP